MTTQATPAQPPNSAPCWMCNGERIVRTPYPAPDPQWEVACLVCVEVIEGEEGGAG